MHWLGRPQAFDFILVCALAAQRKIKWLGTGAEIEAPKALRSETPKASREVGNGEGYPD